jgi:hypothetical protein
MDQDVTALEEKAFANKIACKIQWKHRFALRTIREYKKFIYLGAVSDFVVPLQRSLTRYGISTCSSPKPTEIFASMFPAFLLTTFPSSFTDCPKQPTMNDYCIMIL